MIYPIIVSILLNFLHLATLKFVYKFPTLEFQYYDFFCSINFVLVYFYLSVILVYDRSDFPVSKLIILMLKFSKIQNCYTCTYLLLSCQLNYRNVKLHSIDQEKSTTRFQIKVVFPSKKQYIFTAQWFSTGLQLPWLPCKALRLPSSSSFGITRKS